MSDRYITVVTTSFNCVEYIEDTIKSVLGQGYPALKYVIVDAASKDGSIDVINKYRGAIDIVVLEPDEGMYHGIQKGAFHVDTEIMSWLNADDKYLPWTLSVVDEVFRKFPQVDWVIGLPSYINQKGQCIKVSSNAGTAYPGEYIQNGWFRPQYAGYLQQESMFWRKSLWDRVGGLDLRFKLAADFELWTRFAQHAELYSVTIPLASFRMRPGEQKSSVSSNEYIDEVAQVCEACRRPSIVWRVVSSLGEPLRVLSRLAVWKRCKYITYSQTAGDWVMLDGRRPLSRYSLVEALLELRSR